MKKVLNVVKKVLLGILCAIFLIIATGLSLLLLNRNDYGVTKINEKSLIMIDDKVSTENYKKGDLVIVKEETIDTIEIGKEIFTYKVDSKGKASVIIGIVSALHPETSDGGAISLINGEDYGMKFVAGTATEIHPKIGTYLSILLSQWGFFFIILIPIFFIFIYQLYALIIEIKYGKEEEKELKAKLETEPKVE